MRRMAIIFALLLLLWPFELSARTTATFGQNAVGTSCNNTEKTTDFDAIVQCNAGTGAGTMQTAPLILGSVTAPPYASTTCDSNKAGMLQWTGAAVQACDGSTWHTLTSSTSNPDAFSFTNQTGVAVSTTISSNAVTLSGFTGTLTATCGTNCTAIARNGTWGSTTVTGFVSGDTIAIRLTSSATANTTKNATVTVGSTTSGTWSVTTTSDTPTAFSFTDQTGVYMSTRITSNTVTLSGFTGTMTATCNGSCVEIARNGLWSGASTLTGFVTGDTIAIRQLSSSSASTATTATVTVGSTTSSTWTVTTMAADPCAGVTTPGAACTDGTVYVGITPDDGKKMVTTRCGIGQTWSGSSCTGTLSTPSWNNDSSNTTATGYISDYTGLANTNGLAGLVDIGAPYYAALACYNLTEDGYSDWYLPAVKELALINAAYASFGITYLDYYWTSTEESASSPKAVVIIIGSGAGTSSLYKYSNYYVRCVRKY